MDSLLDIEGIQAGWRFCIILVFGLCGFRRTNRTPNLHLLTYPGGYQVVPLQQLLG
jgi:hypothetical protein